MFILGLLFIRLLRHLSICIRVILFIEILSPVMCLLIVIVPLSCVILDLLGPLLIGINQLLFLRKVWLQGGIGRRKFYLDLNPTPPLLIYGVLDV